MALFNYNNNIPNGPNNPSADQPLMQENTNSIDSLIDVDHFSFNENNGGLHRQVVMPVRGGGAGSIPPGLVAGESAIYTKTANGATQVFFSPDASGNEYQLTHSIAANFATFGNNTTYVAGQNGGWTFLPGGLIMQYGSRASAGSATTINFPITFTQLYTVTANRTDSVIVGWSIANVTNASFQIGAAPATAATIYWMAIGSIA